jgi:triosephosphate isomerase
MRRKIVAGNWKMNTNLQEAALLAEQLKEATADGVQVIVCPPFPWLGLVSEKLKNSDISTGAQNCSNHLKGAFTGEVSAAMLASAEIKYVILGHSERRSLFGETDDVVLQKTLMALQAGLQVILCIGETLEERQAGRLHEVIARQTLHILKNIPASAANSIVLAYEPVWAIGTGITATPEQAQDVHAYIRDLVGEALGQEVSSAMPILYGGSCNPTNAKTLFSCKDIDGGLIGGASLKAEEFKSIIHSF